MTTRDELLASLSQDLTPVKPALPASIMALGWLLASVLWVVALTHLLGPIRPGAFTQLEHAPHFQVEVIAGVFAIIFGTWAVFQSSVPGLLGKRLPWLAGGVLVLWWCNYALSFVSPILPPTMLGKRAHCAFEVIAIALPPMLAGFYLLQRQYPLRFPLSAGILALMAGMMPALYMQIACMHAPAHGVLFHLLPGVAVSLVGVVVALLWRPMRRQNFRAGTR